jgi:hypothetical protein
LQHAFAESYGLRPFERGIAGLIAILEHEVAAHKELHEEYVSSTPSNSMSIFSPVPVTGLIEKMIGKENIPTFINPLVRHETTIKDITSIERLAGKNAEVAKSFAENLLQDLERTTTFPGTSPPPASSKEKLLTDLNRLIMQIGGKPYTPPVTQSPDLKQYQDLLDFGNLPELPNIPEFSELEKQIRNLDFPDFSKPLPDISDLDELNKLQTLLDNPDKPDENKDE